MTAGDAFIGRQVGNWRLLRLLGEGAFGAVYEAENAGIAGKRAAVKILHPHMSMHVSIKQRFLNEASAASRADHENIVQIFDGGITDDGVCYSVMELLKGAPLTKVIEAGPLDLARLVNLGAQVAGALDTAHQLNIVHRDLKPDNIFVIRRVNNPEFVKVLDFGVAKLREPGGGGALTGAGVMIGTPGYMSPEQWMTLPDVDGRADVYALGVILFQCATGRLPFNGSTQYEFLQAHINQPVPDPGALGCPAAIAPLIVRMLAKQREARPQTMAEVMQELQAARGQAAHALAGPQAPTLRPLAPKPMTTLEAGAGELAQRRSGRTGRVLAIALGALVLAGGGGAAARWVQQSRRAAEVAQLEHEIDDATTRQDWDDVITKADRALAIDPGADGIKRARAHAVEERDKRRTAAAAPGTDMAGVLGTLVGSPLGEAPPGSGLGEPPVKQKGKYSIKGGGAGTGIGLGDIGTIGHGGGYGAGKDPCKVIGATSDPEKTLADAQEDYVHGRYADALEKACIAGGGRGWRIVGAASCYLRDRDGALYARSKLDGQARSFLDYVCDRNGIKLH